MAREQVGIGFIGAGMMCQIGHLPFYREDARCRVVAVAESRPSLVKHMEEQGLRVVRDCRELLEDDTVEAVVVCAPRPATGPLTLEALESGKHVIAEKPMAHTVEQAGTLVDAAIARQRIYAVGFMKRYDPGVETARTVVTDALATGRFGRLLSARFYDHSRSYAVQPPPHRRPAESRAERFPEWPLWPDWLPEPLRETYAWFLNAASHDVNLLRFFFPAGLEVVSAISASPGAVTALMRHEETPIILDITRTAAGRWLEGAEFLFEDGRVALNLPSPMARDSVGEVVVDEPRSPGPSRIETERGWCFERQARGFVDVLTQGAAPATSGEEGLADLRLIEQIWRRTAGRA